MGDLSLIIFSICLQAAIGLMVFVAIAKFLNNEVDFKLSIVTAAVLGVIALIASLLHLGRPLSALNSLTQFGSSWLSREIWFSATFTGLTVVIALLIYLKPTAKGAIKALIPIAAIVGIADVYIMASIYNYASVPAWQHSSIFFEFYAAMISIGAILLLALNPHEAIKVRKSATVIAGLAIVLQIATMILFYIQLGADESLAAQQSLSLLNGMSELVIMKYLFILLGVGLLFFSLKQGNINFSKGQAVGEIAASTENTLYISTCGAAALLVVGQVVGRYIFYAIMVITTIG